MNVASSITTTRLSLKLLSENDKNFIFQLLNSEGWLRFIGDRNIKSVEDAEGYIQKIDANKNIVYWTVSQRESGEKMGVITFIKRDYLPHPDVGFAFLPQFASQGFAYEAVAGVLAELLNSNLTYILATTLPENINSVKLLKKIGLHFEKEFTVDNLKLNLYGSSAENIRAHIDGNSVNNSN